MHHTLPQNPERAYMKTIVCADSDRALGCHMIGPHAGEIIQGLGVALRQVQRRLNSTDDWYSSDHGRRMGHHANTSKI